MSDLENSNNENASKSTKSSRRSFIKKAAVGAPVVIASSAKPVWASTDSIACMSGVMSGNLSGRARHCEAPSVNAKGPNWWNSKKVYSYKNNRTPAQTAAKRSDAAGKLGISISVYETYIGNFYYEYDDNTWLLLSVHKNSLEIDGFTQLKKLLKSGTRIQKELAAALLNAYAKVEYPLHVDYPYTPEQVIAIYEQIKLTPEKDELVADMLEAIRNNQTQYAAAI